MKPALVLAALLLSNPAQALLETCTVTALPVSFGSYNPVSGAAVDAAPLRGNLRDLQRLAFILMARCAGGARRGG